MTDDGAAPTDPVTQLDDAAWALAAVIATYRDAAGGSLAAALAAGEGPPGWSELPDDRGRRGGPAAGPQPRARRPAPDRPRRPDPGHRAAPTRLARAGLTAAQALAAPGPRCDTRRR
jgi:hypothetical protein